MGNMTKLLNELRFSTYSYVLFFMFAIGILVGRSSGWWYCMKIGIALIVLIFAVIIGRHQRKLITKIEEEARASNK